VGVVLIPGRFGLIYDRMSQLDRENGNLIPKKIAGTELNMRKRIEDAKISQIKKQRFEGFLVLLSKAKTIKKIYSSGHISMHITDP